MKPNVGFIINGCLGDVLNATPIIRYISKCHGYKISVQTNMPFAFINNPYIEKIYNVKDGESLPEDYLIYNTDYHGSTHGKKQIRKMHMTDYWSSGLGFILSDEEKTMEFFPDELDIEIPTGNYIFINPSVTWASRTWSAQNWKDLIDEILKLGLKVVINGKKTPDKGFHGFEYDNPNVIDNRDKTTLSQAWHLMEHSLAVVTMDAGILHLAGTTSAEIIQLGSGIDNKYRAPFRNGSQNYRYKYILGECALHCQSDMSWNICNPNVERVKITDGYPSPECHMRYNVFKCHPQVDQVKLRISNLDLISKFINK